MGSNYVKVVEDRPVLSATRMLEESNFWQHMIYGDICTDYGQLKRSTRCQRQ